MDLHTSVARLLESATLLLESKRDENTGSSSNLKQLLQDRLRKFYQHEGRAVLETFCAISDVQLCTAQEALGMLERIERVLLQEDLSNPKPLLGTRDCSNIRTLISLVFKWGTAPLLARVHETWKVDLKGKRKIVEVLEEDVSYSTLSDITTRIMGILFPNGVQGVLSTTFISTTLTNRHLVDIFRASIPLGWLPPSLSTSATPTINHLRPFTMRMLALYVALMLVSSKLKHIDAITQGCRQI